MKNWILRILNKIQSFFSNTEKKETPAVNPNLGTVSPFASSQQHIGKSLDNLTKYLPQEDRFQGALCYETVTPYNCVGYNCPVCGSREIFSMVEKYEQLALKVDNYRSDCRTLKNIGWDVKLDETFLCSKCRKEDQPENFFLEITIDGKTTRTEMKPNDLNILLTFAWKKTSWTDFVNTQSVLKNSHRRLRTLLGMEIEEK